MGVDVGLYARILNKQTQVRVRELQRRRGEAGKEGESEGRLFFCSHKLLSCLMRRTGPFLAQPRAQRDSLGNKVSSPLTPPTPFEGGKLTVVASHTPYVTAN